MNGLPGLAPQEVDDVVGEHVGDVPVLRDALAVDVELRIDRLALSLHRHPAGPSRPPGVVVAHVPLAEEPGAVARGRERTSRTSAADGSRRRARCCR